MIGEHNKWLSKQNSEPCGYLLPIIDKFIMMPCYASIIYPLLPNFEYDRFTRTCVYHSMKEAVKLLGINMIDTRFDFISQSDDKATSNLALLN